MFKDRLAENVYEFAMLLEFAQSLLNENEKMLLAQAGDAFLNAKNDRGILSPEQVLDLWEDSIDSVKGAREALTKKYEIANGLWEARKIKGHTVQ